MTRAGRKDRPVPPGRHTKRRRIRPLRSAVLAFLQAVFGMEREEVAKITGLKTATIGYLEQGKEEPRLAILERLVTRMRVSRELLEELLDLAEEMRGRWTADRWVGPIRVPAARLRGIRELGQKVGRFLRERYSEWLLRDLVEAQAQRDRETARQIGAHLRGRKDLPEQVRADAGCHLWSVAEWLCEESIQVISRDRERAGELAQAALAVAELAPGEERFRKGLQGFCWAHIGNFERVAGGFEAADGAFARCTELRETAVGGDPHRLLDQGRVLGLEASLRRAQGRFTEALRLLREALVVAAVRERPYLLLNYGFVLEQIGDSESAIRVLQEAGSEVPRHLEWHQRFNIGVSLTHLGRIKEARDLLPEIHRLALESESQDNQLRTKWLFGRVAAAEGRTEEALGYLTSVQSEFLKRGSAYDASLASLEIARIYLAQGSTRIVRRLAQEMAPVFRDVGIHQHAQEALALFREAAEREAASVELIARLVRYLLRARRSPGLRFDSAS